MRRPHTYTPEEYERVVFGKQPIIEKELDVASIAEEALNQNPDIIPADADAETAVHSVINAVSDFTSYLADSKVIHTGVALGILAFTYKAGQNQLLRRIYETFFRGGRVEEQFIQAPPIEAAVAREAMTPAERERAMEEFRNLYGL